MVCPTPVNGDYLASPQSYLCVNTEGAKPKMLSNPSGKTVSKQNNATFSKLEHSLFEKVELKQEEKIAGGGIGTSPKNLDSSQTNHRVWAYGFLF